MTPEQLKTIFDGNAMIIIFVWGLLCKYVPLLAKIPNATIPWVGAIGYILARLVLPQPAHADGVAGAVATIPAVVSVLLGGFTSAVWARQLYEGFFRPVLEKWLGWRKAT